MHGTLQSLLMLLGVTVLTVALARQFRLPSMLAYLTVGVVAGPHGAAFFAESEQVAAFAEFGIVFLMFSIGLEFSLARLNSMRRLVFGFGGGQVLITLLGTMAVTMFYYAQDWRIGFAIGAACAMSSTAIVSKLLAERLELHSQAGRQTMAVLLFQDLAVVPFLIILPVLAKDSSNLVQTLSLAATQAAGVLLLMVFLGQKLMRRWFDAVAQRKSSELFMLNVLLVVVGLSWLTSAFGLSLALGAFVGGMLISETPYRHQVEADIRPFRDVLLGLFFVTIGMMLDLAYVLRHWPAVLLALLLLVVAKGVVVMLLTRVLRNTLEVSLRTSAQLAQGGEFGLVLLSLGNAARLLPAEVFQSTMAALLLSMFIAPLLIARVSSIGQRLSVGEFAHRAEVIHQIAVRSMDVRDHVILCGFGRTGQSLARFLDREQIPFIALDVDNVRIQQAQDAGENVVFGNADRSEVLIAAGIGRARAVVVTFGDQPSTEKALHAISALRPGLPVIVRARDDSQVEHLKSLGASEVVPEVLEGGLMLATQMLAQLGVPVERTMAQVRALRAERYDSMRTFYRGESDRQLRQSGEKLALVVAPQAWAVGRPLGELALASLGIVVEAVRRRGLRVEQPDETMLVLADDVLILVGAREKLTAAERRVLVGAA
jgi:CPA2 family monovalent cation:H+ antiporter-2